MHYANKSFPFPPLPPSVDAIRVLTITPGDFSDPLVCTLDPVAFSQKPKYVALSYTWGSSYPDNADLPFYPQWPTPVLTVNNEPFSVKHNLHLALLHLRSSIHPLSVWADAICINQADTAERNSQVALMSFIYTRAVKVVAWLGAGNYPASSASNRFRTMSLEWKAGRTKQIAASLMHPHHTYGTRLWMVQEICLPRLLIFAYGSEMWDHKALQSWGIFDHNQGFSSMRQLLETREKRHSNMMTLSSLIERFKRSQCLELRDRVFGLLGCANDVRASVMQNDEEDADVLQTYLDQLAAGMKPIGNPRNASGFGSVRVDYARSFYDIWINVVTSAYFQAANLRIFNGDEIMLNERQIGIVRTAGIV
ncbi:heterokaryon incompatibility protein-domain-containing protein [Podospora australis]|uniref:Heterokaryon incompatibility protein-domain-containing protein n=1 Tax=Podospora australis TaxID=1536484 RepID=A0AAN6WNG6_9PEZI|nr:heterokaryon incompatibility protein-domain-containing protein [Podospora australis]